MPPDLSVALGPLTLRHPVMCGSGEHVVTEEGLRAAVDAGAAAVVAKSANETQAGRDQWAAARWTVLDERWRELPGMGGTPGDRPAPAPLLRTASLMNRSGLAPVSWEPWLERLARADVHARERGTWIVASVIPGDERELPRLAAEVEQAGLRWLELNLSAPHAGEAPQGAIVRSDAPARVAELTRAVRGACRLPLTVKLTAESADVVALARAARVGGADVVAMTGRHLGFMPDLRTRRPVLDTFGAIGGAWSLPLTLRWIAKTRLTLGPKLSLAGTNGARDGEDVARCLLAGASGVQLATSVLVEGPAAIGRAVGELERWLADAGLDARDVVGEAADHALTYAQVNPRPGAPSAGT